jgi:hypothetical protein
MTTVNGVEVPPGATVMIMQATADAEVIKAADIAAAKAAAEEIKE